MNSKKLLYTLLAGTLLAGSACQHEPSLSDYNDDFTVYTNRDTDVDFTAFSTYYLPDQILLIGDGDEAEYWSDDSARQLLATLANSLDGTGYARTGDKAAANLGVQVSYVEQVTYYAGYNSPYWWWNYPYYWSPGYWGDWYSSWYYPFYVQYGYTAGSLLIEMVDLEAPQESSDTRLPVIWSCYIGGLLTSSSTINLERTTTAVEQAVLQSPYLGDGRHNNSGVTGR